MIKIHLNVRTNYSMLSSLISLDNYFNYAKDYNLTYLAICDNNMYGVYAFYEKCLNNNIIPVVGLNFYTLFQNKRYNLNFIAINKQGYYQLVAISSWIMINNEKANTITFNELKKFLDSNLKIIINYEQDNYDIFLYQQIINLLNNNTNLYLGLNYNNISLLSFFNKLTQKSHIIWNNKVLYFSSDDFNAYKIINAIKKQITFNNNIINDDFGIDNINLEYEQYLNNNFTFVQNITKYDFKIKNIIGNLLKYPTPKNINNHYFLSVICKKGLEYRFGKNVKKEYMDRLIYELDVINLIGFSDYFLIVWDYVNYAKKNDIYVGPGRGSAAGSLVSYLLNITTIDPIKYNLLFERFLNPERISLPDIDIDFEDDKREQVVEYLFKKYGQDHIAYIVTFQTIGIKMALRDISRVFDISLDEANKMSKAVRLEDNYNFDNIFINNNVLQYYQKKYPQIFLYIPYLIGLPRQTGTHAAGIVLSQDNLLQVLPIKKGNNGIYQTQYSKNYLEDLGLIKMDILGLRNLTIIHDIINNINKIQKNNINIEKIPLNDKKTFNILAQGKTTGIFQLESLGMTKVLIEMKPNKLEDIVSSSSLYRPGPQENISLFIKRKNEGYKITYINNCFKDILSSTYGIIVYQEQVMLIIQKVSNFSLAKADILRRAIEKKNVKIMNKLKPEFFQSAINNCYQLQIVEKIWELIYKFSSYGFNRSHAVAYSLLGYQMAYLKANYPSQFLASLLSSVIGDEKKTNEYLQLVHNSNLKILAPSINQPLDKYMVKDNKICLPLLIIKQIGFIFYKKILEDFQKHGKYYDIFDLFIRLSKKGLNKKTYEALCYSNALSDFQLNRTTLFNNYAAINVYVELIKINNEEKQLTIDKKLVEKPELIYYENDLMIVLEKEYEFLGFYLSDHPLNYIRVKDKYDNKTTAINKLKLEQGTTNILCIIKQIKEINDKNYYKMAFLNCYDETGEINITVFNNQYEKYNDLLKIDNIILLNIKLGIYQNKINGILNRIKLIKKK